MRPSPQPALLAAPLCASCLLRDRCPAHASAEACGESVDVGRTVDVRRVATLDQWLDWTDRMCIPSTSAASISLPPYVVTAPRGVPAVAMRALDADAVAFTLSDFASHARGAERRGVTFRAHVGADRRRVFVLGADPDRAAVRAWQRWPSVRDRIERHRPDLVVGPDLGFYEDDQPATRIVHAFAHARMYADLVERGIASLPPFGWVFPSDIDRFVEWVAAARVPGAFLDLQNRTGDSSFAGALRDLRGFRGRLPTDFVWLIKGVQVVQRWRALAEVLGVVCFTSSGPWEEARNGRAFEPYTLTLYATDDEPELAFVESVCALSVTAETLREGPRPRALPQQLTIRLAPERVTQTCGDDRADPYREREFPILEPDS